MGNREKEEERERREKGERKEESAKGRCCGAFWKLLMPIPCPATERSVKFLKQPLRELLHLRPREIFAIVRREISNRRHAGPPQRDEWRRFKNSASPSDYPREELYSLKRLSRSRGNAACKHRQIERGSVQLPHPDRVIARNLIRNTLYVGESEIGKTSAVPEV